ncbi:MAG: hypothetical protein ACTSWC_06915 [Promethearchaeota archaeon]
MNFDDFIQSIQLESETRIKKLLHFSKQVWGNRKYLPIEIQNKCLDVWDELASNMDCNIVPLISIDEDSPISNLIFGSGSFSTGKFQIEQYLKIQQLIPNPPVQLQGIVSNKSEGHKCKAETLQRQYNIPLVLLDFIDWYHEFIDKTEPNPIRATRYWYPTDSEDIPSLAELARRFKIRQNEYHSVLGEKIASTFSHPTEIVSARGYNFQFCSNIFPHQQNHLPAINDTHPGDLTYLDPKTHEKLYAGWQAGAVQKMIDDNLHQIFHGSLIEVGYMDSFNQISEVDTGAILALGEGVKIPAESSFTAEQIQSAMKIIDDYFYCSFEPTGLLLFWGITDKPVPVVYQDLKGNPAIVKQHAVVVGDKFHSGINAWGKNIDEDLDELARFLKF